MTPQIQAAIRGLLVLIGTSLLVKKGLITDAELQQYIGFAAILVPVVWSQVASYLRTRNIKQVQENLGVKPDGRVGPKTIEASK